jgi:hypothetical protein
MCRDFIDPMFNYRRSASRVPLLAVHVQKPLQHTILVLQADHNMSAGQDEPIKNRRNARAAPPTFLKSVYKFYQASSNQQLLDDQNIVDFQSDASDPHAQRWRCQPGLPAARVRTVCEAFDALDGSAGSESPIGGSAVHFAAYESTVLPGEWPSVLHPHHFSVLNAPFARRTFFISGFGTTTHANSIAVTTAPP